MIYRVLVVGLGRIGIGYDLSLDPARWILTHARAFQQHPRFQLTGGVDPDPGRCRLLNEHYGVAGWTSLHQALSVAHPDVVVVAAPTSEHAATVRNLLEAISLRAILSEKPLAYDAAQGAAIERLCRDKNCDLFVNYMRRSDPGVIEVKRRLDSGAIQTPIRGVVWYSKGLIHNGSHFFNLLQYWLGSMKEFGIIRPGRLWAGEDPEPDVQVEFDHGTITFLAAQEEDFSHYTVELIARNGRLRYEDGGRTILWQPAVPDPSLEGYTVLRSTPEVVPSDMKRSQWNVAAELAEALDGRPAHLCDGSDGLRTLEALSLIRGKL